MLAAFIGKRQLVVSYSLGARGFFPFKNQFFFAKTRDGSHGVHRRGPAKGAVSQAFIEDP